LSSKGHADARGFGLNNYDILACNLDFFAGPSNPLLSAQHNQAIQPPSAICFTSANCGKFLY
jgi:hypothetical protein